MEPTTLIKQQQRTIAVMDRVIKANLNDMLAIRTQFSHLPTLSGHIDRIIERSRRIHQNALRGFPEAQKTIFSPEPCLDTTHG